MLVDEQFAADMALHDEGQAQAKAIIAIRGLSLNAIQMSLSTATAICLRCRAVDFQVWRTAGGEKTIVRFKAGL